MTYSPDQQQQPAFWERRRILNAAHFVGFGLVLMLAISTAYGVLFNAVTTVFPSLAKSAAFTSPVMQFLLTEIIPYILTIGLPFFLVSIWMREPIRPFKRHESVEPSWFVLIILVGLSAFSIANLFTDGIIVVWKAIGLPLPDLTGDQDGTTVSLLFNLISVALLPAILEEMSFRGFVLEKLRPFGDRFAVLMSAALFGVLHGNVVQIPFAFILGLFFGYITVRTNNIFIAIFLHFVNNGVSVLFDYAQLVIPDMAKALYVVWFLCVLLAGTVAVLTMARNSHPLLTPLSAADSPIKPMKKHAIFWSSPFMITSVILLIVNFVMNIIGV